MPETKLKNATHMLFIKPATIPVRITLNEIRMILYVKIQCTLLLVHILYSYIKLYIYARKRIANDK